MSSEPTQRVSLPAGRDPNRNPDGTFASGNKASPGRKRGSGNFARLLREKWESTRSSELVRRLAVAEVVRFAASRGVEIDPDEVERSVPGDAQTPQELAAWVNSVLGVASLEHQREFSNRESPVKSKHELSGPDGAPLEVRSMVGQGSDDIGAEALDEILNP